MTWYNNNEITPAIDNKGWYSVASDSTGTKLIACENGGSIWTNVGAGWVNNNTANTNWFSVASNSSGSILIACEFQGSIWRKIGNFWVAYSGTENKNWTSVASNSSGTILVACEYLGSIWTNTDNAGWVDDNTGNPDINGVVWTSVKSDSSGTKLIACAYGESIWTNVGAGWVNNNTANTNWFSVASNSSGSILIACEFQGSIWRKIGNFWVAYSGTENKNWNSVASNSSGSVLIACDRESIWTNVNDAGWSKNNTTSGRDWYSVASNSDGSKLIACVFGESIWTYPAPTSTRIICFKEGTTILTIHGYKPIENLRKGDLIKTLKHGYLPIYMIGKRELYHEASPERIKNQLYKCSKEKYPEIFEDLIITGCHSILVFPFANEEERNKTIEVNGDTYVTDGLYRLPACADSRASVYEKPGTYTIYHFSLENDNYYSNYGVYANGLVVESCSKRMLKELSNMTIF